ncbi:hypothetical protein [Sorangium sp. So ce887]|uniref:hypothetical protein n=1 Tax=Sorangium sp. So ce887 TaxID=3133324 RepID=UPI003F5E990A
MRLHFTGTYVLDECNAATQSADDIVLRGLRPERSSAAAWRAAQKRIAGRPPPGANLDTGGLRRYL